MATTKNSLNISRKGIAHNHEKYFESIPLTYFPTNAGVLPEYLSLPLRVIIVSPPQLEDGILKQIMLIKKSSRYQFVYSISLKIKSKRLTPS